MQLGMVGGIVMNWGRLGTECFEQNEILENLIESENVHYFLLPPKRHAIDLEILNNV